MRLTARDRQILETIHAFDGMMSLRQIDTMFFSGMGRTQPRHRMRILAANGYVQNPDARAAHQVPLGETIYWLDTKGARVVAGIQGETLRTFRWRKNPRFSLIAHDLAVNDFRISVNLGLPLSDTYELQQWIPESEFWSNPDKVIYKDGKGRSHSRLIRPDGFFTIYHKEKGSLFAFLLEMDMGSEDNPRFAREKVWPGVAYLKSQAYQSRFGLRYGRYLVITTGRRRMQNMKAQTERAGGNGLFYFTTFDDISFNTVFTKPVWWLAGKESPQTILP